MKILTKQGLLFYICPQKSNLYGSIASKDKPMLISKVHTIMGQNKVVIMISVVKYFASDIWLATEFVAQSKRSA